MGYSPGGGTYSRSVEVVCQPTALHFDEARDHEWKVASTGEPLLPCTEGGCRRTVARDAGLSLLRALSRLHHRRRLPGGDRPLRRGEPHLQAHHLPVPAGVEQARILQRRLRRAEVSQHRKQ